MPNGSKPPPIHGKGKRCAWSKEHPKTSQLVRKVTTKKYVWWCQPSRTASRWLPRVRVPRGKPRHSRMSWRVSSMTNVAAPSSSRSPWCLLTPNATSRTISTIRSSLPTTRTKNSCPSWLTLASLADNLKMANLIHLVSTLLSGTAWA